MAITFHEPAEPLDARAPGGPDMTSAAVDPESGLATAVLLLEMILLEHGFTQHTVISPDPPGSRHLWRENEYTLRLDQRVLSGDGVTKRPHRTRPASTEFQESWGVRSPGKKY